MLGPRVPRRYNGPMGEFDVAPSVPRWGNRCMAAVGRAVLRAYGWRLEIRLPDLPKFVVIAAPHTTNWEFVFGMAAILALRLRINWWAKHTLFCWPFGGLMRWAGGIPVNRASPRGLVGDAVAAFESRPQMVLGLAPEGTRQRVDKWKTGFYQVAVAARVPIVLAYLDYRRKVVGTGPVITPSGDYAADMQRIAAFYRGVAPKYPERFADPR